MLRPSLALALVILAVGCVAPTLQTASVAPSGELRVVDPEGAPIAFVSFTLLASDAPVLRGSTDAQGVFAAPAVAFDRALFAATGYEARAISPSALGSPIVLQRAAMPEAFDAEPILRILGPHTFDPYFFGPEPICEQRNTCGLSEPVIEAAPGDVLYASATCCVGGAPPVWVSRDGGATWSDLETPGVREAVGIEGDLAVDAAGNVYFTDILVGAMWITSWDSEGSWRHTTLVPFAPLVDRPWVRAGAEDVVYFLYNTGSTTDFHVSTDGGRTFTIAPVKSFADNLGTLAQGPEPDHLWVVANMILYESTDGGKTWSDGENVPLPDDASAEARGYGFAVPAVDESGRVMVAYDLGTPDDGFGIHAGVRAVDGTWKVESLTANGTHIMPWVESGPDGGFVVAWYGVDGENGAPGELSADAMWYVDIAATHDAGGTWQISRADAEPVLMGPMTRQLLDFLQVDLDERGAAHLVYAHERQGSNGELTSYVRTTVGLGLPQISLDAAGTSGGSVLDDVRRPLGSYES